MNRIVHTMFKYILLLFLLCIQVYTNAQQRTIRGEILNEISKEKIEGATVVLKSGFSSSAEILAYSITSASGAFCLQTERLPLDSVCIEVKCIGFKSYSQRITESTEQYRILLKEEAFSLEEIIVKAERIRRSGDTISYNIASFATAQDRSIGDVLSNMPGISVADNGQISYNGNKISHLYIEGNDLFNEKYSIATQNLSYKNVAQAEIIENHQPIKALASSNDGSKREVALNLKLREGAKSKWGGYMQLAGGVHPNIWEGEMFVAKFSESFQSASTFKSNNSGKLIAKENEPLTLADILDMQNYKDSQLSDFIRTEPTNKSDLNENRIKFGPSHILNNSSLWKINERTSIQSQLTYSGDHNDYKSNSQTYYFLTDSVLAIDTNEQYNNTSRNLQGELCIKSNQDNYYLNNRLHASATWMDVKSDIQRNNRATIQDAGNRKFLLSNDFKFIRKYGKHLFQVNSYGSYIDFPESLIVKDKHTITQTANRKLLFFNMQVSHGFDWKRWNFTNKAHFQAVSNHLDSELKGLLTDTAFSNANKVGHLHFSIVPQIAYKSRNFTFSFQLPLNYYRYKKTAMRDERHLFSMPEVFVKWKTCPFLTLFVSGSGGTLSSGYGYAYLQPIMGNYKAISSGFLSFRGKKRARSTVRISYANPIEMLFAHVGVSGFIDTTDKQIEKTVSNTHVFYDYKPGNSRNKMLLTDLSLQKGIDCINGKAELHAMYQSDKSKLIQNGMEEPFRHISFGTDLIVKSTIASWIGMEYMAQYSSNKMKSNLYTTQSWRIKQQLSGVCAPMNQWQIKVSGEHYYNHYDSHAKQQIVLFDVNVTYLHKNNEWFCNIRNAFNERWYIYTEYDELSSQTISYSIRPRTIMIGVRRMF